MGNALPFPDQAGTGFVAGIFTPCRLLCFRHQGLSQGHRIVALSCRLRGFHAGSSGWRFLGYSRFQRPEKPRSTPPVSCFRSAPVWGMCASSYPNGPILSQGKPVLCGGGLISSSRYRVRDFSLGPISGWGRSVFAFHVPFATSGIVTCCRSDHRADPWGNIRPHHETFPAIRLQSV